MSWVTNVAELHDFLSLVAACAPNDFPVEDYLREDEQLTLSLAFSELQNGLSLLQQAGHKGLDHAELASLLVRAHQAYLGGDEIGGVRLLEEFDALAFPGPSTAPPHPKRQTMASTPRDHK